MGCILEGVVGEVETSGSDWRRAMCIWVGRNWERFAGVRPPLRMAMLLCMQEISMDMSSAVFL